jgi:hypothetical protein
VGSSLTDSSACSRHINSGSTERSRNSPDAKQFRRFLRQLFQKHWVVYAKRSFRGPAHVLQYLARYTHRVAISNHRLISFKEGQVTFRYKDYAHGSKKRKMTVSADEFLAAFCCTCYRAASCASGILDSLPIAADRGWSCSVGNCSISASTQRPAALNRHPCGCVRNVRHR